MAKRKRGGSRGGKPWQAAVQGQGRVGWGGVLLLLTDWWELILHFQDHSFPDIFQQADDLVVAEFGQVDSVHGFDVVTHIQLVTSAKAMSLWWAHPSHRPLSNFFDFPSSNLTGQHNKHPAP